MPTFMKILLFHKCGMTSKVIQGMHEDLLAFLTYVLMNNICPCYFLLKSKPLHF